MRVRVLPRLILLCGLFAVCSAGFGQGLSALAGGQKASTPAAAEDLYKRETPRSAIYAYLQSCHQGKYDLSAQYLDLRKIRSDQRVTQGPELAQQLCEVLDKDTQFEVGRLNNEQAGAIGDGLPQDQDRLDSFEVGGRTVVLTLTRTTLNGQQVWLVSPDSVLHIPELVQLITESPLEKKLPGVLVQTRFIGTPLYIWLSLLLCAILLAALSKLISRLLIALLRPLARRLGQTQHAHRLESFAEPLRLIAAVMIFSLLVESLGPSALLRDYIFRLLVLLFIFGCASLGMRIVDVVSDTVSSRLNPRERALSFSVFPLIVRSIKVIVFAIAALSVLSAWGYNTNTILAGLGVGGLAVALAAQKTIENLFGGVSVITDRPVLVGDFCRFGDQVGTIEDIGLRSTRIRTLDRTVVTIPNSVFSTMTLENFAKRDRMWFHPTISLQRDTDPDKIKAMMDAVTGVLKDHPLVDPTSVPLRFTKISKESFDLEVFAYVLTPDFDEFLRTQTQLLLNIVKAADKLGVEFAIPLQETIVGPNVRTLALGPTGSGEAGKSA